MRWLNSRAAFEPTFCTPAKSDARHFCEAARKSARAKDFLRHADIAITAADYIGRPRQATSGLGALLKAVDDKKIAPIESDHSRKDAGFAQRLT